MSKKLQFTDPDRIEKGEDYLNFSKSNITRIDPFVDLEKHSLADILKFEEQGQFLESSEDKEKLNQLKDTVQEGIRSLSDTDREFIELHWMDGMSIYEIARLKNKEVHVINSLKQQAERKLKGVLTKLMEKKPDIKCKICIHSLTSEIDTFIFNWLDKNGWYFTGILKELKIKFKFSVLTMSQLNSHIQYHMGVEKSAMVKILTNSSNEAFSLDHLDNDTKEQVINIKVTSKLKSAISDLSDEYGLRNTDLIKLCLKTGLRVMKSNLELVSDFNSLQINLLKNVHKIKDSNDESS